MVLGSGGASLAVQAVLRDMGAGKIIVISRSGRENYETLDLHADACYLINATPVGMFPDNEGCPVSLDHFPNLEGVFDLIYNPARTNLLQAAEDRGIPCRGGLPMLVAQARASAELFLEHRIPESLIPEITEEIKRKTLNLLLIGMPGCGKTTVGTKLGHILGRPVVDLDNEIERRAGRSASDLIRMDGEDHFRALEHEALREAAKGSGQIIAAGGGVVTREENLPLMRQNSVVILLRRPLSELPKDGRPLSGDLEALYRQRAPLYEKAADLTVDNLLSPEDAAADIIRRLGL